MQQHKQLNNYPQVAPLIQRQREGNQHRYNSYFFYDQVHMERHMNGRYLDEDESDKHQRDNWKLRQDIMLAMTPEQSAAKFPPLHFLLAMTMPGYPNPEDIHVRITVAPPSATNPRLCLTTARGILRHWLRSYSSGERSQSQIDNKNMQMELCTQLGDFYKDAAKAFLKKVDPHDTHYKKHHPDLPGIRHADLVATDLRKQSPDPVKRLKKNDGTSPPRIQDFHEVHPNEVELPPEVISALSRWSIGEKQWISGKVYVSWDHRMTVK